MADRQAEPLTQKAGQATSIQTKTPLQGRSKEMEHTDRRFNLEEGELLK